MNAAPQARWAIPEAITDPEWTTRRAPRRRRTLLLAAGLPAATVVALATGGAVMWVSRPAPNPVPSAPAAARAASVPVLPVPARPHAPPTHPAPAHPPVVRHPARATITKPTPPPTAAALPPVGQPGPPNPTVTVTSVVIPVTPTRPAPNPSTPRAGTANRTTGAAPIPVQVAATARQSITCPAGSRLDVTGSADRSGTLTLTGGGSSRTASGAHPVITVQVTRDARFTAAMTGINPHVAVSCG